MTLFRCREILTERMSEFDTRAKVKKAYADNMNKLSADLRSTIADMVPVNGGVTEKIDKVSRLAVKLWLDFELHRCRILVRLTGTGTMKLPERVEEIRKGSVTLTMLPSLGRYGNNKGSDLENYKAISGGDVFTVA